MERVQGEDMGAWLRNLRAQIEPYKVKGSLSAADDVELLRDLLDSLKAYRAGQQKECVESFGRSVQHDSPVQVHPRSDPDYYKFLLAALREATSLGVEPDSAAAATAYMCVSDPGALQLSDAEAGARLEELAEQHRGSWWVQFAQATWRVRHGDHRGSAESLTRAILAGGPCGMYYTRARVFSYLEKMEQSARDFRKFLELAPTDHRSVPDSHYALALDAAVAKDMPAARRRYAEGEASEERVAPWVGYTNSEVKQMAQLFLSVS